MRRMIVLVVALCAVLGVIGLLTTRYDWDGTAKTGQPIVLAAASLQESLNAAADDWAAQGHARPILSFAASSALARQIQSGAPADLYISADEAWMDTLEKAGLLAAGSRETFLGNALVLIAPQDRVTPAITIAPGIDFVALLGGGRLAMADPDAVPAGKYGKAAFQTLGIWDAVVPRVARGENVRAAMALVERGAAPLGVVYATDAAASDKVRVVATFPENTHPPIRYPLARLKTSDDAGAKAFREYLLTPRAAAIFRRFGFTTP